MPQLDSWTFYTSILKHTITLTVFSYYVNHTKGHKHKKLTTNAQ